MAKKRSTRRRRAPARARRRRSGPKTINVANSVAGLMSLAILVKPFAEGQTGAAVKAGNLAALPGAFQQDGAQAVSTQNLILAATPPIAVGLIQAGKRMAGIRSKRVAGTRLVPF